MKKILMLTTMCLGLFLSQVPINAFEQENTVEYQNNGYYYETVIEENEVLNTRATNTKTGTKTTYYKNSSGAVMWSVAVKGTFSYNGSTSTCTSASVSTTCPGSTWKIASSSASRSGNKANATATAKQYVGGVATYSDTRAVTLACSVTGTLS